MDNPQDVPGQLLLDEIIPPQRPAWADHDMADAALWGVMSAMRPKIATRRPRGKRWQIWRTAFLVGYQYGLDLLPPLTIGQEPGQSSGVEDLAQESFEVYLTGSDLAMGSSWTP